VRRHRDRLSCDVSLNADLKEVCCMIFLHVYRHVGEQVFRFDFSFDLV
jgi:hypothetical protein